MLSGRTPGCTPLLDALSHLGAAKASKQLHTVARACVPPALPASSHRWFSSGTRCFAARTLPSRSILRDYYDGPLPDATKKPQTNPDPRLAVAKPALEPEPTEDAAAPDIDARDADQRPTAPEPESPLAAPTDLGTDTLSAVLQELEEGREVRDEVLHLVESSREFQHYEKDVDFEMNLLRARYHNSDAPMTPARRTQMQAHLHQVQLALMQEHAEDAADDFVESLSHDEIEQLAAMFDRLEEKNVPLQPPQQRQSGFARLSETFADACTALVERLSGNGGGGDTPDTTPDAGGKRRK